MASNSFNLKKMENKLKLKKIITFTYPHEANMARSFLAAHDIEVTLKDEMTVQVYNFLSNAVGGVKLLVDEDQADEALLLLEDGGYIVKNHSEERTDESFSDEYQNICPYCNSENVAKKKSGGYTFLLSVLLLGFPLPFFKKEYYCYDCSRMWKMK